VGEAPATADISAGRPVCNYQQAIRMDPRDDDTDSLDWEDPLPLFGRDPGTAKVVDASRDHPERKVVSTGARNQDEVPDQTSRDPGEAASKDPKGPIDGIVVVATPGGSRRLWARGSEILRDLS
jgi:hypothetical protein